MPRTTKGETSRAKDQTLIIDNGAHTIKAGFATSTPPPQSCHLIPNCIVRDSDRHIYVGSELSTCKDFRELAFRRPVAAPTVR